MIVRKLDSSESTFILDTNFGRSNTPGSAQLIKGRVNILSYLVVSLVVAVEILYIY